MAKTKHAKPIASRNPMRAQLFDPSCRAARCQVEPNRRIYSRKVKHRSRALD